MHDLFLLISGFAALLFFTLAVFDREKAKAAAEYEPVNWKPEMWRQ